MEEARPAPEPEPPGWSLWLLYLIFRPAEFFRHYVLRSVPFLTALCGWAYGITAVSDRIDTRAMTTSIQGRPSPVYEFVLRSWGTYWMVCLALGVLSGFVYYHIGGWWFRKRLGFSGAKEHDKKLARRVYLFAAQAYTVPYILYLLWETLHYESPRAAAQGEDFVGLVILAALFWSIYVSYRGVRTVFAVRTRPARMWFLVLPALLYLLVVGGVVAAAFLPGVAQRFDVPELSRPITIERAAFSVRHPSNWHVDTTDEDYDPDHRFGLAPEVADAAVSFWIHDIAVDPAVEARRVLESLQSTYFIEQATSIKSWGPHRGAGFILKAKLEEQRLTMVVFCATGEERAFQVLEAAAEGVEKSLEPGFRLVRESFAWKAAG